MITQTIIYSLLGGILPALVWLAFWLREDAKRPEPRKLILKTFIFGMFAVVLVLPFQKAVDEAFPGMIVVAFLLWAIFEEGFKFAAAYLGGISSKDDDEPLDSIIYLITAALGFAAFENALFIANPLLSADIAGSVLTGNLRFIGASVLHVVSSSIIGVVLGLTFYKPKKVRIAWVLVALVAAVLFHTAFNLTLIQENLFSTPVAFGAVWLSVIVLLLFFEKIKTISSPALSTEIPSQFTDRHDTI